MNGIKLDIRKEDDVCIDLERSTFGRTDNYITYLSTIAFFCGISCAIIMLKFRGFKASLNLSSNKVSGKQYELAPQVSVVGAYRTSREEYFGNINYLEDRKKITPSMVKLPPTSPVQLEPNIKPSRSAGDLTKVHNATAELRKSTPNVSVQNATQANKISKNELKEQKKLENRRLTEQKKKEKLAAQQREKEEKIRKEREKQAAKQQAKEAKEREKRGKKKAVAPQPHTAAQQKGKPLQTQQQRIDQQNNNLQQGPTSTRQRDNILEKNEASQPSQFKKVERVNALTQKSVQHTRNSLESSISQSSGPPPYLDNSEIVPNISDTTGNTSFGKSAETSSSWDLISQHRQQMSKTLAIINSSKQKHMDLHYDVGRVTNNGRDNSEA